MHTFSHSRLVQLVAVLFSSTCSSAIAEGLELDDFDIVLLCTSSEPRQCVELDVVSTEFDAENINAVLRGPGPPANDAVPLGNGIFSSDRCGGRGTCPSPYVYERLENNN